MGELIQMRRFRFSDSEKELMKRALACYLVSSGELVNDNDKRIKAAVAQQIVQKLGV